MAGDNEALTKEAAKELRDKLSSRKKYTNEEQSDDYDDVLKDMIKDFQNKQQKSEQQFYFEKKFFDYLPNEIVDSEDATNEDQNPETINPSSGGGSIMFDDDETDGFRRSKRDVRQGRNKRQLWYIPLYHHNPVPNIHFYYPVDLLSDIPDTIPAFETRSYNNNPWTPQNNPSLRFHPPGNFYLPPAPSTSPPSSAYLPPAPTNRPPVK